MDLTTWTTTQSDPVRRKRLVFGYTVGSFGAGLVAVVVAVTAGKVVMADEDVPVDVTLATAPEEQKAPEPEPEPEPTPQNDPPQTIDEKPGGCGCRAAGERGGSPASGAALLLGLAALWRRRFSARR